MMDLLKLKNISVENRKKLIEMIYKAGSGDISSSFSCCEIFTYIYEEGLVEGENCSKLILSKGHTASYDNK